MRRVLGRRVLALLSAVVAIMAIGAGTAMATEPAEIGVSFTVDPGGDAGQCGGATGQQWSPSPDWTASIRLDTDDRTGGCELAFGILDPQNEFPGLSITYTWVVSPGGESYQCGNYQGQYPMPINNGFGQQVRVNTDDGAGYCYLTFQVSGNSNAELDVQWWADGDASQCGDALPQGEYWSAYAGNPVTIYDDTDSRPGGCDMSLRLVSRA